MPACRSTHRPIQPLRQPRPAPSTTETPTASYARYLWAVLIARIYEVLPLICPDCGGEMRMIAFVTEPAPVQRILLHIGEPVTPPPISPARSPPDEESFDWDRTSGEASTGCDPSFEPPPEFEFDQTLSW